MCTVLTILLAWFCWKLIYMYIAGWCMSEIIDFSKLALVVANYATYDFLQISWCTWIWLLYINPILLKIDIHVRYTMMLVWNNWFLWKHCWYLQIYAAYDFCKYICVHGFDWSTDPILLKVEIVVRFTMLHVWNIWFLQNYHWYLQHYQNYSRDHNFHHDC